MYTYPLNSSFRERGFRDCTDEKCAWGEHFKSHGHTFHHTEWWVSRSHPYPTARTHARTHARAMPAMPAVQCVGTWLLLLLLGFSGWRRLTVARCACVRMSRGVSLVCHAQT